MTRPLPPQSKQSHRLQQLHAEGIMGTLGSCFDLFNRLQVLPSSSQRQRDSRRRLEETVPGDNTKKRQRHCCGALFTPSGHTIYYFGKRKVKKLFHSVISFFTVQLLCGSVSANKLMNPLYATNVFLGSW